MADQGRECLGDESVLRFLHRELVPGEDARVHAHIASCAGCRRIVAQASRMFFEDGGAAPVVPGARSDDEARADWFNAPLGPDEDWPPRILPPGTHVSRYVVRQLIGAGTGGTVYEAHDPQLGRRVALKLVQYPADQRARLVPEEQALAKLSHPNVVNVYDTGRFEAQTFVVMELVVGTSARDWLEEKNRSWREVVEVFLDAGRGLAASHAVGLIHRDFKPENVIVGADGRARVTDFGLARPVAGWAPLDDGELALGSADPVAPATAADGEAGLAASSIAGTPAYMAPEQFRGRRADERTDQFSFCVAFYRALYRQPPFSARAERTDPAVFAREVTSGRVRPPPPGTDVPAWLERLIRRGLRVDPAARFPSMDALLGELSQGLENRGPAALPRRPLRRLVPAVGLASALVFLTVMARRADERHAGAAGAGRCGNGLVEAAEECDDGNTSDEDGCLATCRNAVCGDGKLRSGVEECDDANADDKDGCSSRCLRCEAGDDRLVWPGNGRCYSRHEKQVPWWQAEAECQAIGAHLATFNVYAELKELHDHLFPSRLASYWIGFTDLSGSGDYRWITGELSNALLPWASVAASPGHCGRYDPRLSIDTALKPWSAEPCSFSHGFVCEKEESRVWTRQNHAYRALGRTYQFSQAREICQQIGAHLVTISSVEENSFLVSQFFGILWLGAEALDRPREFRWVTGEPLDVRLFAPGDPERNTAPNCLIVGEDRMWHDRACDGRGGGPYGVVCEFD